MRHFQVEALRAKRVLCHVSYLYTMIVGSVPGLHQSQAEEKVEQNSQPSLHDPAAKARNKLSLFSASEFGG